MYTLHQIFGIIGLITTAFGFGWFIYLIIPKTKTLFDVYKLNLSDKHIQEILHFLEESNPAHNRLLIQTRGNKVIIKAEQRDTSSQY